MLQRDYMNVNNLNASSLSVVIIEHEEAVSRNPYSIHEWLNYIHTLKRESILNRISIYERAIEKLPRSYKVWKLYLDDVYDEQVRSQRIDNPYYTTLIQLYERALGSLPLMPRLWINYTELLGEMQVITSRRHVFDRALRSLPLTQHERIWKLYLEFIQSESMKKCPKTAIAVYRRYLKLYPNKRKEFIKFLVSIQSYNEACIEIIQLIQIQENIKKLQPKYTLWTQLFDLASKYPVQLDVTLNIPSILRLGIQKFTNEIGKLWCAFATYYVRLGQFENARNIYEEAIEKVTTVRDFSMMFDAYIEFIEAVLTAEMKEMEQGDEDMQLDVDRWLKIYEDVADRRPILLNSVLLRQNPHNVVEWEKRVALLAKKSHLHDNGEENSSFDVRIALRTYAEAVNAVSPAYSEGKLPQLWVNFAKCYEEHAKSYKDARKIFQRAIDNVDFRSEKEVATIYCEYVELELRAEEFDTALSIIRSACEVPDSYTRKMRQKSRLHAKDKVHLNTKLWSLRLDLEESLGDLESVKKAYDKVFYLKVVTPQMALNYAAYLREEKFFEDSFQVYERALAIFPSFPHALALWKAYLKDFVTRYKGTKVERTRDLFEQVLKVAPVDDLPYFYHEFANFEEEYGMVRNVLALYARACAAITNETEIMKIYTIYIKKAMEFFGVAKAREIYQEGISTLPDGLAAQLCMKFAAMEVKLGEMDRARAIYTHASQFCDPRTSETWFWNVWHAFEVANGNEHTFLEMLRIKRSVVALYSQVNNVVADVETSMITNGTKQNSDVLKRKEPEANSSRDAMALLEANIIEEKEENNYHSTKKQKLEENPIISVENEEEINLDDE